MILRKKPINALSPFDSRISFTEYLKIQFPHHRNYSVSQLQILTG